LETVTSTRATTWNVEYTAIIGSELDLYAVLMPERLVASLLPPDDGASLRVERYAVSLLPYRLIGELVSERTLVEME
jgi:hypothetical protein